MKWKNRFYQLLGKIHDRRTFVLTFIIIIAAASRLNNLVNLPYGFFCDEASIGYNAYSIWHTGRDEYDKSWPLFFQAFGEYKNPVFIYSMAPIVGIFGLNEYTVRVTSAIYGLGTILLLFLLTNILFKNKTVSLLATLFLAVSPWHILMSRIGFELISSVFWVTLTIYLLEKSKQSISYYAFAVIAGIVSYFSYNTPKLYLLPLLVLYLAVNAKTTFGWFKLKQFWFSTLAGLMVFIVLVLPSISDKTFFARWYQVRDPQVNIEWLKQAYLNHFSMDFLFKKGDIDFPGQFITRHSIRGIGELYWFQLPLLVAGLLSIITKNSIITNKRALAFILLWLLIYPLGSIFTAKNPQATRSVIGVIPFQILSAAGAVEMYYWLKKIVAPRILLTLGILTIFVCCYQFIGLLKQYPQYSSDFWGWQYGAKPAMKYFLANVNNYDQMCLEGAFNAPEIFIKFYDPNNKCIDKCNICGLNVYDKNKKQLFAVSPDTLLKYSTQIVYEVKKAIQYPNGKDAFLIIEIY